MLTKNKRVFYLIRAKCEIFNLGINYKRHEPRVYMGEGTDFN